MAKARAQAASDSLVVLKPGDYQVKIGTIPVEFVRSVEIDGEQSVLTVKLALNFKKNLFKVEAKLNNNQLTGDDNIDEPTRRMLHALEKKAIEAGIKWREGRLSAKADIDGGIQGMLKLDLKVKS